MNQKITFKISEFLERIGSITKEDLIRSGSRIIWQDHIERLKKQEGVYWLISLNREFVFDLATSNGMIYLIRNYNSKENNIVHLDLNKIPNLPCIIQVAWDVDFIELIITIKNSINSKDFKDFKIRKKTESSNTPIELIKWVDDQYHIPRKDFNSEEDFRRRLIEIIKGIQRLIDTYSNFDEYWNIIQTKNKETKFSPKEAKEIHPSVMNLISDHLKCSNILFSSEYNSQTGNIKMIFTSRVKGIGISSIIMEIANAHSDDLVNQIANKLPSNVDSLKSKFGIFLVLWYKGDRFDKPNYDSISSMEFHIRGSFRQSMYKKFDFNNISIFILDLTGEIKPFGHLNIANNSNLKFKKLEKGSIALYNNKKIIFGSSLAIMKRNLELTELDYLNLAKYNLSLYCSGKKLPRHIIRNTTPILSKSIVNDYSPFYKYVQPEIFEKFIKNGLWQLGTIELYRSIENNKQRDEFEGYSFLNLTINNHIVCTNVITGFNYLIFCATRSARSTRHKINFGEKLLYFPDVKSFAETICKHINAKKYFIHNVEYNTLKFYISKDKIYNQYLELNNLFTPPFFDIINEHTLFPSLFVKPENFKYENEVRIVFEMENDCYEPYTFEHKGLFDYLKY
jgi:hypothetical protein